MLRLSRGDRGLDSAAHGVTARWSRSAAGAEVNLIIALSRKQTDKQYSCFILIPNSHKRIGGLRYGDVALMIRLRESLGGIV